jgi:hypothetical protein
MKPVHFRVGRFLVGFLGLMFLSDAAWAQFLSREQIVRALMMQPGPPNFADRLRLIDR